MCQCGMNSNVSLCTWVWGCDVFSVWKGSQHASLLHTPQMWESQTWESTVVAIIWCTKDINCLIWFVTHSYKHVHWFFCIPVHILLQLICIKNGVCASMLFKCKCFVWMCLCMHACVDMCVCCRMRVMVGAAIARGVKVLRLCVWGGCRTPGPTLWDVATASNKGMWYVHVWWSMGWPHTHSHNLHLGVTVVSDSYQQCGCTCTLKRTFFTVTEEELEEKILHPRWSGGELL